MIYGENMLDSGAVRAPLRAEHLARGETRERLAGLGREPGKYSPEEFGRLIRAESGRSRTAVDECMVRLDN